DRQAGRVVAAAVLRVPPRRGHAQEAVAARRRNSPYRRNVTGLLPGARSTTRHELRSGEGLGLRPELLLQGPDLVGGLGELLLDAHDLLVLGRQEVDDLRGDQLAHGV